MRLSITLSESKVTGAGAMVCGLGFAVFFFCFWVAIRDRFMSVKSNQIRIFAATFYI
jgi:hypothetical protein